MGIRGRKYRQGPVQRKTDQELQELATNRLLALLHQTRGIISGIYTYAGPRCCEVCHEFVGGEEEWEAEVKEPARPWEEYRDRIKEVLAERDHEPRKSDNVVRIPVRVGKGQPITRKAIEAQVRRLSGDKKHRRRKVVGFEYVSRSQERTGTVKEMTHLWLPSVASVTILMA